MLFRNYDPQLVIMVLGPIQIVGYAPGSIIKLARAEDTFSVEVGANNDKVRVRTRNSLGRATIRLQAASPSNDRLSALHRSDELFGDGVVPFLLKYANGTTICKSEPAWVAGYPEVEYAAESTPREWNIELGDLQMFVGGHIS